MKSIMPDSRSDWEPPNPLVFGLLALLLIWFLFLPACDAVLSSVAPPKCETLYLAEQCSHLRYDYWTGEPIPTARNPLEKLLGR